MTGGADALVADFGQRLAELGWISDLHLGGSLATGDHRAGISDLDLVAVGCIHVPAPLITAPDTEHVTWTHARPIQRRLSGLTRAELLRHGHAVFGREPAEVWASMTTDDVRQAVVQEMTGYWTWASRRPWLWLSTNQVDLTVTTMLRARHTLATGELITKSAALSGPTPRDVSSRLVADVRARRDGAARSSAARLPRDSVLAWRMAHRTIAASRGSARLTCRG